MLAWAATEGGFVSRNSDLFAGDFHAFCVNIIREWGFIKTVLHSSDTTHAYIFRKDSEDNLRLLQPIPQKENSRMFQSAGRDLGL